MGRIAAIVTLGVLVGPAALAQEDRVPPRTRKDLISGLQKRGTVTAVASEIGLVVISIGKDGGVSERESYYVFRNDEFIAKVDVDSSDRKWSACRVVLKKTDPRVGDEVCLMARFTVEQRKTILDYAFSFRPLKDEDLGRVTSILADLDSDDVAVREKATKELADLRGLASSILRCLDLMKMGAEVQARAQDALKELDRHNRALESPGIERDIEFLAVIDDPRGYERLKRILSGVRPFLVAGFPEKGPGLAEYLTGWWAYSKDRVRWNVREDRFEDR